MAIEGIGAAEALSSFIEDAGAIGSLGADATALGIAGGVGGGAVDAVSLGIDAAASASLPEAISSALSALSPEELANAGFTATAGGFLDSSGNFFQGANFSQFTDPVTGNITGDPLAVQLPTGNVGYPQVLPDGSTVIRDSVTGQTFNGDPSSWASQTGGFSGAANDPAAAANLSQIAGAGSGGVDPSLLQQINNALGTNLSGFQLAQLGLGGVNALGSLVGGITGANAATGAARTQAGALNNATALQQSIFNQNQANLAPFLQTGTNALGPLTSLIGQGAPDVTKFGAQFQASPGYAFQFGQGLEAINNNAARVGPSGNTLKALTQFGQGVANQDFYNQYGIANNNYWKQVQALGGLASLGQNAAAQTGNLGQNFANLAGQNIVGAGNALAAGQVGSTNALTSGIGNAAGSLQNAFLISAFLNNPKFGGSGDN